MWPRSDQCEQHLAIAMECIDFFLPFSLVELRVRTWIAFLVRLRGMLQQYMLECAIRFGSIPSEREAVSVDNLPMRLRDVVIELLGGKSKTQVASELGISPNAVYRYTKQPCEQFGPSCHGELLATCRRQGSIIAAYSASPRTRAKANGRKTDPSAG